MASIAEVAKLAGVAPSTVSFVMNNNPRISEETRMVVLKAADELKYKLGKQGRPHRAAGSKPVPRRKHLVGFLYPSPESQLRTNITYMAMLQGAEVAAARAGQDVVIRRTGMAVSAENGLRLDGAISIMLDSLSTYVELAKHLPLVRVMGLPEKTLPWDHVTYNNCAIGPIAAKYLLERGHKQVAYFSPFADTPNQENITFGRLNRDRQALFIETIRAGGAQVTVNSLGIPPDDLPHMELMAEIMKSFLTQAPRPTAIFFPADYYTVSAYTILYSLGVRPNVDIEIVSCNNTAPVLQTLHPRPPVVDLHIPDIGMVGIEELMRRIENPDRPFKLTQLEPKLVIENTVRTSI